MPELYVGINKDELERLKKQAAAQTQKRHRPYVNDFLYETRKSFGVISKVIELLSYETNSTKEALDALESAAQLIEKFGRQPKKHFQGAVPCGKNISNGSRIAEN